MMLHQDGSRAAWLSGQPGLDLIVTMDDAASTFHALREVFTAHGLPSSLYTDRGSHYFFTRRRASRSTRSSCRVGPGSFTPSLSQIRT